MMLQDGPDRWSYKEVLSAWIILKCNPDLPNVLVLMNIPFHCPAEFCNRSSNKQHSWRRFSYTCAGYMGLSEIVLEKEPQAWKFCKFVLFFFFFFFG